MAFDRRFTARMGGWLVGGGGVWGVEGGGCLIRDSPSEHHRLFKISFDRLTAVALRQVIDLLAGELEKRPQENFHQRVHSSRAEGMLLSIRLEICLGQ